MFLFVLRLILKSGISVQRLRAVLSAPCSLERLSKEPELLKADQEQLKRQSQVC